jgi:hypothetical protein
VAFGREAVGVEDHERVLGADTAEGIGQGEQAGEVGGVGDEGGPDL